MDTENILLLSIIIITLIGNYLLNDGIRTVSSKYIIDIAPAGFTYSIWSIIYLLLIIISFTLKSEIIDNKIIILYALSSFLNISWLFLFLKERILLANLSLLGLSILLWILFDMINDNLSKVTFGIYASWTLVASIVNAGISYKYVYCSDISRFLSLLICAFPVVLYFINSSDDKVYISAYLTIIWACLGILYENFLENDETKDSFLSILIVPLFVSLIFSILIA